MTVSPRAGWLEGWVVGERHAALRHAAPRPPSAPSRLPGPPPPWPRPCRTSARLASLAPSSPRAPSRSHASSHKPRRAAVRWTRSWRRWRRPPAPTRRRRAATGRVGCRAHRRCWRGLRGSCSAPPCSTQSRLERGSAARRNPALHPHSSPAAAAAAAAASAAAAECCCCSGARRPGQRERRAPGPTMTRARPPGARRWHRA